MALLSNQSLKCSSNYGEDTAARVNVLASCYIVDSAAQLKGIHYCTTGAAGTYLRFTLDIVERYSCPNVASNAKRLSDCRGRVVFLRSLPQVYLLLRQVPPSPH